MPIRWQHSFLKYLHFGEYEFHEDLGEDRIWNINSIFFPLCLKSDTLILMNLPGVRPRTSPNSLNGPNWLNCNIKTFPKIPASIFANVTAAPILSKSKGILIHSSLDLTKYHDLPALFNYFTIVTSIRFSELQDLVNKSGLNEPIC